MPDTAERARRWIGPLVVAAAAVVMIVWSWARWPDVIVDFGRELYVPWQLSESKTLYRDLAYFNGPLSPSVNALWFRLFGVSLRTLAVANIVVIALILAMIHRLCRIVADRIAAAAACLVVVTLFAFANHMQGGNFNYVCPYSHELTHGLVLALAAITCFDASLGTRRPTRCIAGAGLALGLLFLTKAEVFAAGLAAVTGAWLLSRIARHDTNSPPASGPVVFFACLIAPPLAAFLLLCRVMPAARAWQGTLGDWPWILRGDVASMKFFRTMMGFDDPIRSVARMAAWSGGYLLSFGAVAAAAFALRRADRRRLWPEVYAFLLVTAGLAAVTLLQSPAPQGLPASIFGDGLWANFAQPLPLMLAVCLVTLPVCVFRRRRAPTAAASSIALAAAAPDRRVTAFALAVFATLMLAKVALNVHLYAYGFIHAMPAVVLLVVALVGWMPAWITRRGGRGGVFRAAALACVATAIVFHVAVSAFWFSTKTTVVGRGADAFSIDAARGNDVQACLDELARISRPDETLTVFPEGVMMNYLARRANPTPFLNFIPPELLIFGEQRMLASLQARPPDFVAIVHRPTEVYGPTRFGIDYAASIAAWIGRDYRPVRTFGAMPFSGRRFGVLLLRRDSNGG